LLAELPQARAGADFTIKKGRKEENTVPPVGRAEIGCPALATSGAFKQPATHLMAAGISVTTARLADYHRADADDPALRSLRTPWEQE